MSNVLPFQPGAATLVDGDPTGVFAPAIVGHIAVDPSTGDTYVGIGTTSADWKPTGGGGGGGQPGTLIGSGLSAVALADGPTSVPCDGSPHQVSCVLASPPSWMDDAGNITAAGLYWIGASISVSDAATVPGLSFCWVSPSQAVSFSPIDAVAALNQAQPFDVLDLATADLPFTASAFVAGQTDVTAVLSVRPLVIQLASATT